MSDELVRELEEDQRHQQMVALWQRYRDIIIGGALAIVLGVSANQGWNYYTTTQQHDSSLQFSHATELLRDGQREKAMAVLDTLAQNGTSSYATMAHLITAYDQQATDDEASVLRARDIFKKIAYDSSVDPLFSQLAALNLLQLDADKGTLTDKTSPEDAGIFTASATEMRALQLVAQGKTEEAKEVLKPLLENDETPPSIRERALQLQATL